MSYRLDLDEQDEERLKEELDRRKAAREQGVCDYCGRAPSERPCKFPHRHFWNHPYEVEKRKLRELLPYYNTSHGAIKTQAIANGVSRQELMMTWKGDCEKPSPYDRHVADCTRIENFSYRQ